VPPNVWFCAFLDTDDQVEPSVASDYCLLSCVVLPAFRLDFSNFEIGKRSELTQKYPQHRKLFEKYCKD
jgi:predicted cupin superfamily sugar epimerase